MSAFLIAAPSSGAGKTTIALGLMRAMRNMGMKVQPAKSGPDYIDPKFHGIAAGRESLTLDAWAMPADRLRNALPNADVHIVEGAMGLFDGAGLKGGGSAAALAKTLRIPIVLVVDAAKQAHSIAALVTGFMAFDPELTIAGVILNKVGSARHEAMLRSALGKTGVQVLGTLPRNPSFTLPERHLGLIQASEVSDIEPWMDGIAAKLMDKLDIDTLLALPKLTPQATTHAFAPPAQNIAVARDLAFEFCYPHLIQGWRAAGASVSFFSPLANDPVPDADYVYLPGGYPELHAGQLSVANRFFDTLRTHAETRPIYGECGGYITLGDGLVDADGMRHQMAGLLRLETSFAQRKLHLGYRQLTPLTDVFTGPIKAHEFHYTTTVKAEGQPLFTSTNADGTDTDVMGLQLGSVFGSFAHIIDGF